MNKKFTIIIVTATILLVALLIAISVFRSRPQSDSPINQFALPTSAPVSRRSHNSFNNNQVISPAVSSPKQDALFAIQNVLPYDSDALTIGYSALANQIYIEKKSDKADEELKKFLEINNLTDVYVKFPDLFKVITGKMSEKINNENNKLFETYNDQFVPDPEEIAQSSPTPTPNPNDPSSQALPMMNAFKSLMGFNITLLPYSPTTQIQPTTPSTPSTSSGQGTTPVGSFQNGFPVTPADTTKIPCPISPTVSEIGIKRIFANGIGFYNIRVCKVHGYTINSVKAKDFDNMYTAMKLAGYTFKGGGNFRTYEAQAAGYAANPSAWAPPGGSNHERGLAVDTSCSNKDGGQAYTPWMNGKARGLPAFARAISEHPCLNWIHNNSSRYGLLLQCDGKGRNGGEISKDRGGCETWHLSPTGG